MEVSNRIGHVFYYLGFILFGGTNLIMLLSFNFLGYEYSNIFVFITKFVLFVLTAYLLKKGSNRRSLLFRLFCVFWIFWSLKILFYGASSKSSYMLFTPQMYMIYALLFSIVPFLIGSNVLIVQKDNIKAFYNGTKIGLILFCATTLLLYFNKLEHMSRLGVEDNSLNPLAISYAATLLLVILLWEAFFKKVTIFNILCMLLCMPLLGLGASKGSLLAIFLVICVFLYLKKVNIKLLVGSICLVLVVSANYKRFYLEPLVERLDISLDRLGSSQKDARYYIYEYSLNKIIDSPTFGYFSNLIASESSYLSVNTFPHNIILESFFVLGILGGALMLFFCISSFIKAIRISKYRPEYSWILALFIVSFSSNLVSGNIYSGAIWFWFFVAFIENIYKEFNGKKI